MNTVQKARRVIQIELDALRLVQRNLGPSFPKAVQILSAALQRGRKIVVCGIGKSGHIGQKIAATLTSTGAPAVVLDPVNATHGDLGIVSEGDALILLSYSGETDELLRLLPLLDRSDLKIVALTGRAHSSLARHADAVLDVRVAKEACPHNLAPTASTAAMLAMGDALAMVLLEERGFRKEDFARIHPGGALGKSLLLKASEVMRPAASLAVLPETALVRDALKQWNLKRTGAVVVVKKTGKLAGIFTHGDFIRRYEKDAAVGDQPLRAVMTPKPITVRADRLAVEVLALFQKNRIDDLVVVDDTNRPVGLVDAQDITKHRIV